MRPEINTLPLREVYRLVCLADSREGLSLTRQHRMFYILSRIGSGNLEDRCRGIMPM